MLALSVAAPLANRAHVVVSAWRDVHEGAQAHLIVLPKICRVDVKPLADSMLMRFVRDPAVELYGLPAGDVASVGIEGDSGGQPPTRTFEHQHTAFRAVTGGRTVDVSIIMAITHLDDAGIARITAQAILAEPQPCAR